MPSSQTRKGCGCALAVAAVLALIAALVLIYVFFIRKEERVVPPPSGGQLQIHVLDVGQGDSILIISPTGKAVLIDAGVPGSDRVILDALKRYDVKDIDLFIATHAHADHIGSAAKLLGEVTVHNVLDSKQPNTTQTYERYLEAAQQDVVAKGGKFIAASPGQTFDIGGGAVLKVLAPIQPFFTKSELRSGGNEPNANSVVVRLDYGKFSMLFTGDAEAQTETRMMENNEDIKAQVLKVGHHGSHYASSEDFLRRGGFKDAIISDGADNRYGHPSPDTLDRMRALHINVYRTDLQGEITVTSNGDGYKITTQHAATGDLYAGRRAEHDDSTRTGFTAYGDFDTRPRRSRNGNGGR